MRRRCACTFRQREPLIWMGNDDHVSIPSCLSVQLVGYVTAFPAVNGFKKLEWQWCGPLPQSRWVKNRPQTFQHYSAFMLLEARVWVTCLYCAGGDGKSTDVQKSSRKHILVLQMLGLCFSFCLYERPWEKLMKLKTTTSVALCLGWSWTSFLTSFLKLLWNLPVAGDSVLVCCDDF